MTPDLQLGYYVTRYYAQFMTADERVAHRHLVSTAKNANGRSDAAAQEEVRREGKLSGRWLSEDPAVLSLAAHGLDAFLIRCAQRILSEHRDEVYMNRCAKCGSLARTPRARLCVHCGHSWHNEPIRAL